MHLLIDPAHVRVGSTAVRSVARGASSTLALRTSGTSWTVSGCGTERTGAVVWARYDGTPLP